MSQPEERALKSNSRHTADKSAATKILLVDDDAALRQVIKYKLDQRGYLVTVAADGEQALRELKRRSFDLILSDIKMPKVGGVELLVKGRKLRPEISVILMTAFADISQAVEAVKLGASDYLTKPFEDEQLFVAIDKAVRVRNLESENRSLKSRLKGRDYLEKIVGVSKPFKELMSVVQKIAPSDATVLITGASGVGKEVIARAIHYMSNRAGGEFVAVNCAAIPRDLIESELFGHVRGAFTGAVRDKRGKFEIADGGTLLLDEIADLGLELQAKLLRVMQEKTVEPVGSESLKDVDFRLIAATNANLKSRVADGLFREDLYYRLNVIPLAVPSLNERAEDIPVLVAEFLKKYGKGEQIEVSSDLMEALVRHLWPGNIRELDNLVERMVVLRSGNILTGADLPKDFNQTAEPSAERIESAAPGEMTFKEAERKLIVDALTRFDWNKSKSARFLDIPRHVLVYRMKKHEIFSDQPV